MARPDDIVGYTFEADNYCPAHIMGVLPTHQGGAFDGWADATGTMDAEAFLTEIAHAFGIDRDDESSFDSSDDFPKVILRDQIGPDDRCSVCYDRLDGEEETLCSACGQFVTSDHECDLEDDGSPCCIAFVTSGGSDHEPDCIPGRYGRDPDPCPETDRAGRKCVYRRNHDAVFAHRFA